MLRPRNNVQTAILAICLLAVLGTVGYRAIEGWSWFECFYMTIITLATIGYQEPANITLEGRYFTVGLIVLGVGTVGFAATVLAQSVVQGELLATWERRRVQERIKKLQDHIIICGVGRVGLRVFDGLAGAGVDVVVVERERERLDLLPDTDALVVLGDATREDVLQRAGIDRARGLVAALPSDADNVFITLTARELSHSLLIIARVNDESTISKMHRAGADKVISPLRTGANQILQAILRPNVAEFMELATMTGDLNLAIEEVAVDDRSPLNGKRLLETNLRQELNVIVVGITRAGGDMLFNPSAETSLRSGDNLIVIGSRRALDALSVLAGERSSKTTPIE